MIDVSSPAQPRMNRIFAPFVRLSIRFMLNRLSRPAIRSNYFATILVAG